MDNLIKKYREELGEADTSERYDKLFKEFLQALSKEEYDTSMIRDARERGKYFINKFSSESTKENMFKAKEKLISYLEEIERRGNASSANSMQNCLERYLNNFYLFLEAFRERKPDKRVSFTEESLQNFKIVNEYDLQHLLFAVLKPLFIDIRKEVTEDSGVGAIRSDIKIPSLNAIIETKCTARKNVALKKLTEEIEADIVHYQADILYFYIYDKEKVIKDKYAFETNFTRNFDGKKVKTIVVQPINM